MDQALKQRLIGALVLIALAVIFLPLLLDGKQEEPTYRELVIPAEPVVELKIGPETEVDTRYFEEVQARVEAERAASQPIADDSLSDDLPASEGARAVSQGRPAEVKASEKAKAKAATEVVVKPAQAAHERLQAAQNQDRRQLAPGEKLTPAYTLRLGTFAQQKNAQGLYQRLLKQGYKAYMETNHSGKRTLYRVYVGPVLRKNRAIELRQKLQRDTQLKAMLVRYSP